VTGIRDDYQQNWRTVTARDAHTDGQAAPAMAAASTASTFRSTKATLDVKPICNP
jgi:hypothetical protein